jgi:pimeloyl-ACP methyl ester carboxylesterase
LQFERVEMIHPYWDCALVKVAGLPTERSSIVLDGREPDDLEDRDIVIIGYPAQDSRNDLDLQLRIFRGIFQRKRMQPGRVRQYRSIRSYNNVVEALTHDCSTLGGNSGSVVLDVTTGRVIGLHFAGVYLEVNFAVPTWALAEDAKVVDCGVSFHEPPAIGGPPLWNKQWLAADSGKAESEAPASGRAPGGASRPSTGSSLLGLDWYERIDDAILQDAIERDLQGTRQKLIEVIGQEAADEVIDDLSEPMEEGLFTPEPDPSLPEIIYLHGIMGSHLANHHGSGSRVWFNFLAFAKGNIAEKMTLEDDGFTDADPRFRIGADGHLRLKYAKATRRLRKKRFVVHEFSYDWRKPIESASNRLHGFIEQLVAANPGRRFVLVAHSMGGLVSSIYAQQHSNWLDRIDKAVFVGSPLGGSYAPIEAVLGVYPFFTTLAKLSRYDDLSELQELATTLPGLLEMMPNPELFADPVDYYVQSAWPDNVKLQQNWLDQSKDLKEKILSSPLLERTTGIVSREFGTISNVRSENARIVPGPRTGPGDGTVPIRAAAVTQLSDLYEATGKRHADMMNNTDIIKGVADIVRTGSTSALEKIRLEDIDFDEILPETEAIETTEDQLEGVRGRMEKGHLTAADVDWLFDPLVGAPPQ